MKVQHGRYYYLGYNNNDDKSIAEGSKCGEWNILTFNTKTKVVSSSISPSGNGIWNAVIYWVRLNI